MESLCSFCLFLTCTDGRTETYVIGLQHSRINLPKQNKSFFSLSALFTCAYCCVQQLQLIIPVVCTYLFEQCKCFLSLLCLLTCTKCCTKVNFGTCPLAWLQC
eukprot:gnl/MRDRNA2_/MRDRNA2_215763_c0_seq1.p2 gnl/MRDRNA2_/MRDRNA2_215763_c0~~gnl/MRDRNA2_/MRDRNA2_215763_c0_seq1.p2  ORF type:complete len:103 (+),score=6.42 gnl/MRDRNA2_/MRDRNA2_215763_c0_seq1:2-310(+)